MNTQLYRASEHIHTTGAANAEWRTLLYGWATEPPDPDSLARALQRGMLIAAALLGGSGLIFWIAANWQDLSRGARLALIEGSLLMTLVVACFVPRVREASLLASLLVLGGLLALIGQTYQTGADSWQLFAAWAVLSLPWVLGARSDLLWTPWVGIAALALSLSTGPLGMMRWFSLTEPHRVALALTFLAWLVLGLVPLAVAHVRWLRLPGGLGRWSHRLSVGLALGAWTGLGIASLFYSDTMSVAWPVAAVLVMGMLWMNWQSRWRDLPCLSLAVLAANVLVMSLAARFLLNNDEHVMTLLTLGVLGLICLGGSATWLLRQQQTWGRGDAE
ncbi:DUF2157 domain-containing protein [Ottowia thiooxydans]|uniref:DUF2157 domain-containing protein n=1 Tax=Ottowia thiooxydans TaxID=219182 RepID=UPI00041CDE61|nr:DUF2157 domain-containing protein [Ottowia thiooxydans]